MANQSKRSGLLGSDRQQFTSGFHLLNLPGQALICLDDQRTLLGVADQRLLARPKQPHQRQGLFGGQVQFGDGRRVGDGVAVDAVVPEGSAHALLLVEGREHLLVAVNDVLHPGSCGGGDRGGKSLTNTNKTTAVTRTNTASVLKYDVVQQYFGVQNNTIFL